MHKAEPYATLLVPEGVDGVDAAGLDGWVDAEDDADGDGDAERDDAAGTEDDAEGSEEGAVFWARRLAKAWPRSEKRIIGRGPSWRCRVVSHRI